MHNGYFIYFYHSGSQKTYILTKDCTSSSFGVDIAFSPMIQQWTFNCHSPILSQKRIPYYIIKICYIYVILFTWYFNLSVKVVILWWLFFVSLNVVYLLYMDVSGFFFMLHAKPKFFFFLSFSLNSFQLNRI